MSATSDLAAIPVVGAISARSRGQATLPKNFFGIKRRRCARGEGRAKMAEIAAPTLEKNGHLKTKFGQYAALATQGVLHLCATRWSAPERDRSGEAGRKPSSRQLKPVGDDQMVLPYLQGISFTEQRMYR